MTTLHDWEFSGTGPAVADIAWCEWIVRMHHPTSVASLTAFVDAYGEHPPFAERQRVMVERCRWLEAFSRRRDPHGDSVRVWRQRTRATATWTA